MKRFLAVFLSAILSLGCAACGYTFVGASWNGGGTQNTSGLIVIVHFSSVPNQGTFVAVTFVTLLQNGSATTFPFCGDQSSQFPMNQFVSATFMPGQPCNQIVTVVIGPH
jgi:hypothetical protein